jgi:hypothetical protein
MTKEEALKVIETKLAQIRKLISECETIADESQNSFYFSVEYGMGGTYYPKKPMSRQEALDLLKNGKALTQKQKDLIAGILQRDEDNIDDDWTSSYEGWQSSSNNC